MSKKIRLVVELDIDYIEMSKNNISYTELMNAIDIEELAAHRPWDLDGFAIYTERDGNKKLKEEFFLSDGRIVLKEIIDND